MTDFSFFVERDQIRVRFVAHRTLGRLRTGHSSGGDYGEKLIRLPRWETVSALRAALLHELGHYLCDRTEFSARDTTEEEVCDLLAWLPMILLDERNAELRSFLGVSDG